MPGVGKRSTNYTKNCVLNINRNIICHGVDGQHLLQVLKMVLGDTLRFFTTFNKKYFIKNNIII